MEDTYVRFEPSPLKIQAWRQRLRVAAADDPAFSPAELYLRAIPTLQMWKRRLIDSGLWRDASNDIGSESNGTGLPPGMLFVLESTAGGGPGSSPNTPITENGRLRGTGTTRSARSGSYSSGSAVSFLNSVRAASEDSETLAPKTATSHGGGAVLALPAELSAFIEYRVQLEDILQDPVLFYPYLNRKQELVLEAFDESTPMDTDLTAAASTIQDIFYLLQLLIPGVLLIVHDSLSFVSDVDLHMPGTRSMFHTGGKGPSSHPRSATVMHLGGDSPAPSPQELQAPLSAPGSNPKVMLSRMRRGVPPVHWITKNAIVLDEIFGPEGVSCYGECAGDPSRSVWTTVYAADGKRLEVGADLNFSAIVDDVAEDDLLLKPLVAPPIGPTPGRSAHSLYLDFTRRSRTL